MCDRVTQIGVEFSPAGFALGSVSSLPGAGEGLVCESSCGSETAVASLVLYLKGEALRRRDLNGSTSP